MQDIGRVGVQGQGHHVGFRGHHVAGGQVAEVKDVFDPLLFLLGDGPLLAAVFHHQADILLAGGGVLGLGLEAEEFQRTIGGQAQQRHHGGKDPADAAHDPQRRPGPGLGALHGDPLGHHLAEGNGKEGDDQRDHHHGHHPQHAGGHRQAQPHQEGRQIAGEVLGAEGGAEKARQGDGHLDGRQKAVGVFHQRQQPGGGLVAPFGLLGQFDTVQ